MSKVCYTVIEGETRKIKKKYLVLEGQTHEITRKYIVVNGQTRLCYQNTINISTATVTLGANLTYNGSQQTKAVTVTMDGVTLTQGTDYTVTGNTATNAGNYTMTITGTGDYEGTVQKAWSIARASGSISVSPASLSIVGAAGTTKTATISYTGDGSISVSSSNSSVATASRSGNTITVTLKGSGSATITISIAETDNYTGASCTLGASCAVISSTLNDNSWATIQSVAAAGNGANYWSVGDRKAVTLNGTVGIKTFSNVTYYPYILGFNHNSSIEGNGIHFQFGFSVMGGTNDTAFVDDWYDSQSSKSCFSMNLSATNISGWGKSNMRTIICAEFLDCIQSDLKNIIPYTTKYTNNGSGYTSATNDKIFILAEYEVWGKRLYAAINEQNYQAQYAYYANGNSKVKYKNNGAGSACYWWLRSAENGYVSTDKCFCVVTSNAAMNYGVADRSQGFAPAFRVA